jgi:hypothetical protein
VMTSGRLQSLQPSSRGSLARFTTMCRGLHPGTTHPLATKPASISSVRSLAVDGLV